MLTDKGVKRVLKEIKDYKEKPESEKKVYSLSFEENDLQNFFVIIRSMDGVYEGGEYILRIKLPDEYPFKPPVISCMTPNGRFKEEVNICLNISHFHSESWSPLINLEKIILSVMSVFYDDAIAGIGSIVTDDENKKNLASQSKSYNRRHFKRILEREI